MAIPGPLKQRDGFLWVCDAQWSHDGQETVGEGFLWDCYAVVQ